MKKSILLGFVMTSFVATAQASLDPAYFSVGSVEVREMPSDHQALVNEIQKGDDAVNAATDIWFEKADAPLDVDTLGSMIGLTGSEVGVFIAVGKEIWTIIKENQPVMNTTYNAVSVLPKEVTAWDQMAGWQAPKSTVYQVTYKNFYGVDVIRFSYRLTYTSGGTYNGKGQYLSNVSVSPVHVRVLWGFELNSDVKIKNIQNTASLDSPVPGVEVEVGYNISTIFVKEENAQVFYVRGDGYSQKLN